MRRRLLDHDRIARHQRREPGERIARRNRILRGRSGRPQPRGRHLALRDVRHHRQQPSQRLRERADDGVTDRSGCGFRRIIRDLPDRRSIVEQFALSFDMESKHRRADHDDQIGAAQCAGEPSRCCRKEAGEQRMQFRKARTARHRACPNGRARLLGHSDHRVDAAAAIDLGSDNEDRFFGGSDRRAEPNDRRRIGRKLRRDAADRWSGCGPRPIIRRDRHECRTAGMLHSGEEGLRDRRWNIFGARRFGAPFHIGLWKLCGVLGEEIGSHPQ